MESSLELNFFDRLKVTLKWSSSYFRTFLFLSLSMSSNLNPVSNANCINGLYLDLFFCMNWRTETTSSSSRKSGKSSFLIVSPLFLDKYQFFTFFYLLKLLLFSFEDLHLAKSQFKESFGKKQAKFYKIF